MSKERIAIFGAGGLAREVAHTIMRQGFTVACYLVSHETYVPDVLLDELERCALNGQPRVWSLRAWRSYTIGTEQARLDGWVVAVGDPKLRQLAAEWVSNTLSCPPQRLVDPSALTLRCERGTGSVIQAGSIVSDGAKLGHHAFVNYQCCVGHDADIGAYAVLCPNVQVMGKAHVGSGAFIGTGAIILPGRRVGSRAMVGAGAVVVCDIPEGETWAGVPAKRLRLGEHRCEG